MIPLVAAIMLGTGKSRPIVLISNVTLSPSRTGAGSISAGVKVLRGGQFHTGTHLSSTTPTYADVGGAEWSSEEAVAIGDDYECRMDYVSGDHLSAGTEDTWLAMTSDRSFEINRTTLGATVFSGTLRIREVGSVSDLDTAAISLTVTASP